MDFDEIRYAGRGNSAYHSGTGYAIVGAEVLGTGMGGEGMHKVIRLYIGKTAKCSTAPVWMDGLV